MILQVLRLFRRLSAIYEWLTFELHVISKFMWECERPIPPTTREHLNEATRWHYLTHLLQHFSVCPYSLRCCASIILQFQFITADLRHTLLPHIRKDDGGLNSPPSLTSFQYVDMHLLSTNYENKYILSLSYIVLKRSIIFRYSF